MKPFSSSWWHSKMRRINLNSSPYPNKNTKNVFDSSERQRRKYLTPSQEWLQDKIFPNSMLFVREEVKCHRSLFYQPQEIIITFQLFTAFTAVRSPWDAKSKYKHFLPLHPCLKCCETNNDLMEAHWVASHEFSFIAGQIILLSTGTKIF